MIAKLDSDIQNLRIAGSILSEVLLHLEQMAVTGISTAALDLASEKMMRERGAVPAFLNYRPSGAAYPFPAALCVSINQEVVHGIPSETRVLEDGDIVTLDLGLSYSGLFVDSARTVLVGECDVKAKKLSDGTREALSAALAVIKPGAHVGDIGAAVQAVAQKYSLSVVEELGGHALGKTVHEKPFIPNVGTKGSGEKIMVGHVLAIEPILTEGKSGIMLGEDEWTYRTRDGSRAAHWEQTVIVTDKGIEILTAL